MSASYPKVHVVGSGAYYSYRPITRFIEKADRNHIRDSSSRPKEFAKYVSASTTRGDGFTRRSSLDPERRDFVRGSSLPPLETPGRERRRASVREDESFYKRGLEDSFFKDEEEDAFFKQRGSNNNNSSYRRRSERAIRREQADDELVTEVDKKALFSNGEDILTRLRRKHPYRLAVENEVVPPHESSVWPENRPHFDLVSSYDVMMDYLGIRDKSQK